MQIPLLVSASHLRGNEVRGILSGNKHVLFQDPMEMQHPILVIHDRVPIGCQGPRLLDRYLVNSNILLAESNCDSGNLSGRGILLECRRPTQL